MRANSVCIINNKFRPPILAFFLLALSGCDLEFRSGWFAQDWETEFRSDLVEPIINSGVECPQFRYRQSTKWRDSYLVECSADGEHWDDAFLVWPRDGRVRRH